LASAPLVKAMAKAAMMTTQMKLRYSAPTKPPEAGQVRPADVEDA